MSSLWKSAIAAAPALERWIGGGASKLEVGRLPRPAWPIVAGVVVRACAAQRRPVLILVPAPERFCDELRPWLAGDPSVLLMDEPFAALDAQTREAMQEELVEISLKARKTILFITHQIDEAIYLSDRVIVFSARPGRVRDEVKIAIDRPRKLRLKRDPIFHALEDTVWSLVHDEPPKPG